MKIKCAHLCFEFRFVLLIALFSGLSVVQGITHPSDVEALQELYVSLNCSSQLTGWTSVGGDPCEESWMGITCHGSAIVSIQISGLGLSGSMGYMLSFLGSLKTLDVSDNRIHESIPYQLPPNLTKLNIANNNFSGNLPYSIASSLSLSYLNTSSNSLGQSIGDIFANLTDLLTLDLSHNNFSGYLPTSFASLSNLLVLHLQNNQLTGSLNVLDGLPLTDLNVANNNFSGSIPQKISSISNFIYGGNLFDESPASPPPRPSPASPPPRPLGRPYHNNGDSSGSYASWGSDGQSCNSFKGNKNRLTVGPILGIVLGSLVVVVLAAAVLFAGIRKKKRKDNTMKHSFGNIPLILEKVNNEGHEQRVKPTPTTLDLRSLNMENLTCQKMKGNNESVNIVKSPVTATSYNIRTLQGATNSFSQENLVGEGTLGRVYRGQFHNGKVMAIKKIENAALSLQDEDNFLEAISHMSRLRHPNIVPLTGYCTEHGQRLLVHDYIGNRSLQDMLYSSDDRIKVLTWNVRIKLALGIARALEYLHEVCLPSVVHRNLKSANILLDQELNPYLSDCGLAALLPNTERQVSSAQMVGSLGYSAPEFALSGIYTVKSDVYSFGVLMLELLTGRKPLDSSRVRAEQSLVRWATPHLHDLDALARMVDPTLNGLYAVKSLLQFADIIDLCVQPEPEFRPPTLEVVQALVQLLQRASIQKRRSSEDLSFYRNT
ncbi:protein STRUBBELIG-RECEPTOR FAMILY 8 [Heracleum sosnowskyi]|uniref:Protein STRUBBELIG-RECEPTOR FAMILY 8 n=1 Tax=Heracleum sosnowskyi TaxID=360622 RepID=A0AAD8GQU3_9APIA|nr:protein STRUBBELIG-RECEPTOR FAMILY 8 [Heracleum sosnowskyi]